MRAATYRRVSSAHQANEGISLGAQREACAAEVARRCWVLSGEYEDAGLSGASADRPAWNEMLDAARRGEIDAIVVHALSRFSRSLAHTVAVTDELTRLGVSLVSLTENLDLTTPAGRMTHTVMAGASQMERELTAQRVALALRSKVGRGEWPGGELPYGYRAEGGRVVEHPEEAEAVRRIVRMVLGQGMTTGQIAEALAAEGYRGRRGGVVTHQYVRRLLKSRRLLGEIPYGDVGPGKSTAVNARGVPIHGDTLLLRAEPIVPPETFEHLQRVLAQRAIPRRRDARVYPLSAGVLFCPDGHRVNGNVWRGQRAYKCSSAVWVADSRPRCEMKAVKAEELEPRVYRALFPVLGNPAKLQRAVRDALAAAGTTSKTAERDLVEAREALAKAHVGLSEGLNAAIRAGAPASVVETVTRRASADIAAMEARVSRLEAIAGSAIARGDEHLQALARAASRLSGDAPPAEMRDILALLGVRVRFTTFDPADPVEVSAEVTPDALSAAVRGAAGEPVGHGDEIADLFVQRDGVLRRADGFPPHLDRFERAGYDITALLAQE